MKKTMIFTLILMPLIVLGVLLLSGNIVNKSTYLYVEYIEFVDQEIVLQKDTAETVSGQVKVNVFPILANNKEVEFWSEDEGIVSVNQSGNIIGHEIGSTYVYAMSKENNTKKAYCRVVVTSDKVQRLSLLEPQKDLYVGDTYKLNVEVYPNTAINTALDYDSSNTEVAVVDRNGEITVVGKGSAVVTATLRSNPDLKVSFTCNAKPRVSRIEIADGNNSAEFSSKTEFKFPTIAFYPVGADEEILYRIVNETEQNIATVDSEGNVTFNGSGKVCVEAYIPNTDFKVIKEYTSTFGGFSNVWFLADSPTNIDYDDYSDGKELQIKYNFAPQDASANNLTVSCTDANGNVSNVIVLEDGKLTVKRGGEATITVSGIGANGEIISASSRIMVNRKATEITFIGDSFSKGEKFVYAGKEIVLNASGLPQDANDKIFYQISDDNLAIVSDGKLHFTQKVIDFGYGKVKVRAYTDKGISNEVVVVYLNDDIKKFDISDRDEINLTLPATGKGAYSFALVQNENIDFNDISFEVTDGTEVISNTNGSPVFTLNDKGTATITVRYFDGSGNETSTKTITVNATRLVEQINDLKVTAVWGKNSQEFTKQEFTIDNNNNGYNVYSSATRFEISYSLYPENSTTQTADITITERSTNGIAEVKGNSIEFTNAGWVKVRVRVDDIERQLTITSSYLHPDETTAFNGVPLGGFTLDHDKSQTVDLFDYITMIKGADKSHFTFTVKCDAFTVDNGTIKTNHGGKGCVTVSAKVFNTKTNTVEDKKWDEIIVYVKQSATKTETTKGQYFYTEGTTFDVKDLFAFYPNTANQNIDIEYEVVSSNATINGTVVTFKGAGSCVVSATLNGRTDDTDVVKITVVCTGNTPVVSEKETVIIKGTTVIIKLAEEVLENASYNSVFSSKTTDITVDGVFITVNGNGKVTFGGQEYSFVCLETNTVSIKLDDRECESSDDKYTTGAQELSLGYNNVEGNGSLSEYIGNGYATLTFDTDKGSIDGNTLKFNGEGEYTVTLTLRYADYVVGKKDYTNTVTINTTFGVAELSVTKNANTTKLFDEKNSGNNYIDITEYLTISPKPFTLNGKTVSAEVTDGNATVDTDNSLKIKYTSGGKFKVKVTNLTDENQTIEFTFTVNRYATDIILDNVLLSTVTDYTVTGNRATMYINPIAMPLDANLGTNITWEITDGTSAVKPETNDRIVFSKANEKVKITFTLNGNTFTVTFVTTSIMFEVDLDQQTIIVPQGERFTFISSTGELDPSKIVFTGTVDGVEKNTDDNGGVYYMFTKSFNKRVEINYDTYTISRQLVSVSNKQSISSEEIKLIDVKMDGSKFDNIETQTIHTTASETLQINTETLNEYGADGEQLKYAFEFSDNSIASVTDTGEISFNTAGTVKITVSITYKTLPSSGTSEASLEESKFTPITLSYEFNVTSTYGAVTGFSGVEDSYTFIYDEMEREKLIDLTGNISRTAPKYGVSDDTPSIVEIYGDCVEVEGTTLKAVGSGTATVTVGYGTATKDVTITIDKYIDEISITENSAEKEIYQVVTKAQEYTFNYKLSATPSPTYKDITVSLKIDGNIIGQEDISEYVTVSNGKITLRNLIENSIYNVTLTANNGKNNARPTAQLQVLCVNGSVNIIDLSDDNNRNTVLTAKNSYVFENRYSNVIYSITDKNKHVSVNGLGVFSVDCGDEGSITLTSGDNAITVNYVATENVESISLDDTEWAKQEDILTALGEGGIDLQQKFAPTIFPETARTFKQTENGYQSVPYTVKYEIVSGNDIAEIKDGKLYFTQQGKVELKISCTDSSYKNPITKTITSTLGYYYSVDITVSFDNVTASEYTFKYTDTQKTPTISYTCKPSDIDRSTEKAQISISSSNGNVFMWENGTCTFTGGGSADLKFTYKTSENNTVTKTLGIYVIKRAESDALALTYNNKVTDYAVVSNTTVSLGYNVTGENLSEYNVWFESGNTDVATVDDKGVVTFKGNGEAVITVKVADKKNGQGIFDVCDTITLRKTDRNIVTLNLDEPNDNTQTLYLDEDGYIIYPYSLQGYTSFAYNVTDGTDILSVNEAGEITLENKGGYATVTVTAKNSKGETQDFNLNLYVYKKASISVEQNNVTTANREWQITPEVNYNDGSMVGKTIVYTITEGKQYATVNGKGLLAFESAGKVTVTVKVMYNDTVDASAECTIQSTCGTVTSFELYQVTFDESKNEVETKVENDTDLTVKSGSENQLRFRVKNICPSDCEIKFSFDYNSTDAFNCAVDSNNKNEFTLLGVKDLQNGELFLSVSGSASITLNVTVIQLAESVEITYKDNVVGEITTRTNTVTLGYRFNKGDQSASGIKDKSVIWEIESGTDYATITQDGELGVLKFKDGLSSNTSVVVKVTSGDGACQNRVTVTWAEISGFTVDTHNYETIDNADSTYNGYIYVDADDNNNHQVTFTIQVQGVSDFDNWGGFKYSTQKGSTVESETLISTSRNVTVKFNDNSGAEFDEVVTITYNNFTQTVKIYRDGITRLQFVYATTQNSDGEEVDIALDETLTKNAGLQQMLVFGDQSYYGGVQDYYNLTVRTKDISGNVNESIVNGVVWEMRDSSGNLLNDKVSYNKVSYNGSTAQITTKGLEISSAEDMYKDLFNNGAVTLTAKNLVGKKFCSYTFHFVSGVNVWDETGYINCGSSAVLHKDIKLSAIDTPVTATVYGNGNWLDLSERNSTKDNDYGNSEYVTINLANAINVRVKGSKSNDSIVQLVGINKYAYSEFKYLYRLVASTNSYIKRCALHEFKYAGIISQIGDENGFYLEDIVMYDVGPRGIEIQSGCANVKGFLDVYNYQNKDMIVKAFTDNKIFQSIILGIGDQIIEMASQYKVTDSNKEDWVNMVGISTKGQDKKINYWDSSQNKYIVDDTEGKQTRSAYGLCTIRDTVTKEVLQLDVKVADITAWTYDKDITYLKLENQWVYNAETKNYDLNTDYLANTTKKLERIPTTD